MEVFLILKTKQLQRSDEGQSVVERVAQGGVKSARTLGVREVDIEDFILMTKVVVFPVNLQNAPPKIVVKVLLKDVFTLLIEVV